MDISVDNLSGMHISVQRCTNLMNYKGEVIYGF